MDGDSVQKKDCGWHFIVLMSRQGKIRLSEFFSSFSEAEKRRILRDIAGDVLPRQPKMCNIIEKGSYKFVYRRYASLYFVAGVPLAMNELIVLEQIHLFVEALDGYFNSGESLKGTMSVVADESWMNQSGLIEYIRLPFVQFRFVLQLTQHAPCCRYYLIWFATWLQQSVSWTWSFLYTSHS